MIGPVSTPVPLNQRGDEHTEIKDRKSRGCCNRGSDHFTSSEFSKTENSLIEGAYWVLVSNWIVAYWPFSRRTSLTGTKYLNFHLPTFGFFITVSYIILDSIYIGYYFLRKVSKEEVKEVQRVDQILIAVWDLMVAVSVIGYRSYGLFYTQKFQSFWKTCVDIVAQISALGSETETELKLAHLRRWTLKWLIVFALLGIADCSCVIYTFGFVVEDSFPTVLLYTYLESVICMHNSSALMLIFFIKVFTYGFTVCKQQVEQLTLILYNSKLDLEPCGRSQNIYGNYDKRDVEPEEAIYSSSSSSSALSNTLQLVEKLENIVDGFNYLFGYALFLEAVLGFWQVMFAMYFLSTINTLADGVTYSAPIMMYSACFVAVCMASSGLSQECLQMLASFQNLPAEILSDSENYKIQILVTRLSSAPPEIQVGQLFSIRGSLIGSALNTLATYFIVLVQLRQQATTSPKLTVAGE